MINFYSIKNTQTGACIFFILIYDCRSIISLKVKKNNIWINVISIKAKNDDTKNIVIIDTVDDTTRLELNATSAAKIDPTVPASKHLLCIIIALLRQLNLPWLLNNMKRE
ncbi:MAG: hypothetical protein IJ758_03515 [Clostridia bacterium]|nr:hypothetical protein [Clostridia bacterium]